MIKYFLRKLRGKHIDAAAAAWLAEQDAGMSVQKTAELARWRAADPAHEEAVARLDCVWEKLHHMREILPEAGLLPDPHLSAQGGRGAGRRFSPLGVFAAAGAVAALAVILTFWIYRPFGSELLSPGEVVYGTDIEGTKRIILEDGSIVELNADSKILVRLTPVIRRVTMVRGEAHFLVAREQARPFQVEAGGLVARALGTAFNIRLSEDQVQVLVTEGRVEIEPSRPERRLAEDDRTGNRTQILVTGERVVSMPQDGNRSVEIDRVVPAKIREAIGWQSSQLVFVDTPLGEALEQFNARNRTQVLLGDPSLAATPIGGSFRSNNIEAFVRLLSSDEQIRVERFSPDRIILHFQLEEGK